MSQAKQGDTVKVHYTGKLEDGTVFDSSSDREPLQFTLGQGNVIPGFEQGVVGMEPGQTREIKIPAEQAYGERRDDWILTVDRGQLPPNMNPAVGQRLELKQPSGQAIPVTVTDVDEQSVTLDANHPLAGKELHFDAQLVEIV